MDSRERILTKAQQTGWKITSSDSNLRLDFDGQRVRVYFDSMNRVRSAFHFGLGDRLHGVNEVMETLRMFGGVR